jgi:hypothetical protein
MVQWAPCPRPSLYMVQWASCPLCGRCFAHVGFPPGRPPENQPNQRVDMTSQHDYRGVRSEGKVRHDSSEGSNHDGGRGVHGLARVGAEPAADPCPRAFLRRATGRRRSSWILLPTTPRCEPTSERFPTAKSTSSRWSKLRTGSSSRSIPEVAPETASVESYVRTKVADGGFADSEPVTIPRDGWLRHDAAARVGGRRHHDR